MNWWWVNHKQTRSQEVGGKYLWSPLANSDGSRNSTYESMKNVRRGDVVFSYANGRIGAIGVATGEASPSSKPVNVITGVHWSSEGWLVPVHFRELSVPVVPKDSLDSLVPLLPKKYSPLQSNGNGNQKFYLVSLPQDLATELLRLVEARNGGEAVLQLRMDAKTEIDDVLAQAELASSTDITETERQQLVLARKGQGLFRAEVIRLEKHCRVTGVTSVELLRASHIRPWRVATNADRLDGNNGLLLAPHVDQLFDRGLISFTDVGELLLSKQLDRTVLTAWGIPTSLTVGPFRPRQLPYLGFHRASVFRAGPRTERDGVASFVRGIGSGSDSALLHIQ